METEVRMVLYEDDSVEVHYIDGSKLQLSPCGSEYLFEKAPPISAHPLQQPERIRQRTQFVISNYREQLLRALDFRNCFSSRPFLPESIIPSERKQSVFTDISEVRWPSPDTHNAVICLDDGMVKISSLDGYASLCLPKEQHEFTIRFLCKISQRSHSLSEKKSNNLKKVDKHCGKASKNCMFRASSDGPSLKNKENDSYCHFTKSKEVLGANNFINGSEGKELAPLYHKKYTFVYIWVKQCWSVDSCPEEWKYPLSLAFNFLHKLNNTLKADQTASQITVLASCISKEGDKVSVLPRALPLSCHNPHLHRWNFSDSSLQEQEYIYPELIKVVWYKGTVFRLTHETVNSIEIFPGDGSILKSEGTFWGNYFTLSSVYKGSEQANQGVTLGWCKLTLPDGQDQLIQIEHPGQFERYVAAVVDWCRSLTRANPQKMLTYPSSSSITEEKWSIISELEKIQKFNFLLENDSILNQISTKKTEQSSSDVSRSRSSEPYSCFEEVNKKSVSIALKKTSEILQDIESLLACSKK
ncbi:uncharacterized protein C5orf34 homolog isoform X3 [Monodelphis domestica]|uniref:uncharacterized protein C5orf34 homolog isoform X3 n=1 Tax=Monodelphis domestica TaxID=13616 RepID=UPI0024E1F059|nr:uncharacterized protein C5orf34 homolog isoform X3 [Monodelphis domestica]